MTDWLQKQLRTDGTTSLNADQISGNISSHLKNFRQTNISALAEIAFLG